MKIGIYMDTGAPGTPLGGTEYSAAVLAEELANRHDVDLVHHRANTDRDEFFKLFGTDLSAVRLRYVEKQPLTFGRSRLPWRRLGEARAWHAEVSRPYEWFIAFIHLTPPHCHARHGMFTILFPFIDRPNAWPWKAGEPAAGLGRIKRLFRGRYYKSEWRRRIDSYQVKAANSYFTAQWVRARYGAECQVHYPPSQDVRPAEIKKDLILSVGRFSTNKNQMELAGAFAQLPEVAGRGWEFCCVGAVDEKQGEGKLYFEAVRSLTEGRPVRVLANVALPELKDLYREAKIFWHAAGYPYDETRTPHVMEHFGIVTVEAMAAGCVPVVINKGGQPEIVEHGASGFLWNTLEELKGYTCLLARDESLRRRMAEAAEARAQRFTKAAYIHRFYELVPELTP
jgi:glycosyltransferase involved in cell wall biosynthesis